MSVRLLLVTVLFAASLALAPSAGATTLCLQNNTLTFSPPLTLANQIGTVTLQAGNTCADAPLLTPSSGTGSLVFNYFGSCALAVFTDGPQSLLVGSVLYVVNYDGAVKIEILQPAALCPGPVTTAHGTGIVVAP